MAAYHVELAPSAASQFKKIDKQFKDRIGQKLDSLEKNPRPHGVEKLEGEDSLYRVRVGDYRIVYQLFDRKLLVLVVRIAHRRDVYR